MSQRGLCGYQCFQDDIFDGLPDFFGRDHGLALLKEMFPVVYWSENGLKTAFVADIIPFRVSIKYELHALLVNRIICQVHHHVVEITWPWLLVLFCCKTGETLLRNVCSQGINTSDQNVDAQVEFEPWYEVGLVEVSLSYKVLICILHPVKAACEEDAFPLATRLRLHNKCFCFFVIELQLEIFSVLWEDPGRREKVIIVRALSLHGLKVSGEQIFPCQCMHTREVIYSLIWLHLKEELGVNCGIKPVDVPVRVVCFRPGYLVVDDLSDIPQHIILRVL